MITKISDLNDQALNWAVAKCECPEDSIVVLNGKNEPQFFKSHVKPYLASYSEPLAYSTSWAQSGPIIERERITLRVSTMPDTAWIAFYDKPNMYHGLSREKGTTALKAAMRCYVHSKLGDEIDVPGELL